MLAHSLQVNTLFDQDEQLLHIEKIAQYLH